jgi:signal transduction histidine kinase
VALPSPAGELRVEIVISGLETGARASRWRVGVSDHQTDDTNLSQWRGAAVEPDSPIARCFATGEATEGLLQLGHAQGSPGSHSDQIISVLALPLRTPDDILGVLALVPRPGATLTDEQRELVTNAAGQAALALMLARGRREQERIVLLEERDRIARDLHDLVIQRLFATGISLSGAARVSDTPQPVVDRLESAVDALDTTVREIRATIFELHQPVGHAVDGVRGRVLEEAAAAAVVLGHAPATRFTGTIDALVGDALAADLLGALREALANVAKHADADHVEVLVAAENDVLLLQVTDDGVGVPDELSRRSGLLNLAERAARYGGSCTIVSGPAGGSVLSWRVPLN